MYCICGLDSSKYEYIGFPKKRIESTDDACSLICISKKNFFFAFLNTSFWTINLIYLRVYSYSRKYACKQVKLSNNINITLGLSFQKHFLITNWKEKWNRSRLWWYTVGKRLLYSQLMQRNSKEAQLQENSETDLGPWNSFSRPILLRHITFTFFIVYFP
jgi:hypothetical protein